MQEKYGFVYIWYDRKHTRFYIGSHWGTEDDGYICSSRWMRNSYRRRPHDFKRRIISRVYTDRSELLNEEYRWLSYIPEHQLGKKYYNLTNHRQSHWTEDNYKRKSVSQKIKDAWTDERRHQMSNLKRANNPMHDPSIVQKALDNKMTNNPDWGHWVRGKVITEEQRAKQSAKMKGREPPNKGKLSPRKGVKTGTTHQAKQYLVTHPNGDIEVILNLKLYCISKGYAPTAVHNAMAKCKPYRGIKFEINK